MRHRRMLAPINTIKHYVGFTKTGIASGAKGSVSLVGSVVAPATASAFEVNEGSVIKAIFIELWLKGLGASDADTAFTVALEKIPGGASGSMSFADMANLGAYDNKKNVLFTSQGVLGGVGGGQAVPIMRGWYKIPKGKQRFGLNDFLVLNIAAIGQTIDRCGISTYKEYR